MTLHLPPSGRSSRNVAPTVRVGGIMRTPSVLRGLGVDPTEILRELGLGLEFFADGDRRIPCSTRNRILRHCADRTRCPHFGLLVGKEGGLHSLGLVGLFAKYSPDVGTALRSIVRYRHLHAGGALTSLDVRGSTAILAHAFYERETDALDILADGALAILCNVLRSLCGPAWKPLSVGFMHPAPSDVEPYRRFFLAPLSFNAGQNGIVFSADWLTRPLGVPDGELQEHLQKQIDALDARHGDDFPEQVRNVLRTAIVAGHGRMDKVANVFSMPPHTLARRLKVRGVGWHELVDGVRFEIARQLLESSDLSVGEIAELLDYAAPGAFTRAFRRWCGIAPSQWRKAPVARCVGPDEKRRPCDGADDPAQ